MTTQTDRTDIGFDTAGIADAKMVQKVLDLPTVQDVARVAIAYAARRGVDLKPSSLRGGELHNTLKGSELDQSGAISRTLSLFYPHTDDLDDLKNLYLEYLMNRGVRMLAEAVGEGTVTSLASLLPETKSEA